MNRKNALISVFNKAGIDQFAFALTTLGWTIYSSGGTAKALTKVGIDNVINVATLTGRGPILEHRVVTLCPEIHGGLLATEEMLDELREEDLRWFDLVCTDFYPLQAAVDNPELSFRDVIDQTDIGGPTMVRSAVKGDRIVIVNPEDRLNVLDELKKTGDVSDENRRYLCAQAERYVADYVALSAKYRLRHAPSSYKVAA